jgi:hypothetical protein
MEPARLGLRKLGMDRRLGMNGETWELMEKIRDAWISKRCTLYRES